MYPVAYEADFVEQRNRLTTFFRPILAIPWFIVAIFWGVAALVCSVIAWFAIVFTGRYPEGLYDVVVQAMRYSARVNAFTYLLTDEFPPFDGGEHPEYPVRLRVAPPLPQYSRWKTALRFILLIPIMIVLYLLDLLNRAIGILSWLVIVITGRHPRGLFDVMKFALVYEARAGAYLLLVTETYPPFSVDEGEPAMASSPPAPPLAG
ncbi:MAG: hypothetical protein JWQ48_94 [Conexibacter sp.]|nr:hypothetical protein [Conexibacter sp.]